MAKSKTISAADDFFANAEAWQEEFEQLRAILLDCQLDEELKWGQACYTYQNKNIVLIHGILRPALLQRRSAQ